jgi:hypothetical protein
VIRNELGRNTSRDLRSRILIQRKRRHVVQLYTHTIAHIKTVSSRNLDHNLLPTDFVGTQEIQTSGYILFHGALVHQPHFVGLDGATCEERGKDFLEEIFTHIVVLSRDA